MIALSMGFGGVGTWATILTILVRRWSALAQTFVMETAMTDQTPPAAPIVVKADPRKDRIEARLRQFVTVFGPLMAVLTQTPWGHKIGLGGIWASLVSALASSRPWRPWSSAN